MKGRLQNFLCRIGVHKWLPWGTCESDSLLLVHCYQVRHCANCGIGQTKTK